MKNQAYKTPDGTIVKNVKSIEVRGKEYLYDGDVSWKKWKRLLVAGAKAPDEIDFYKKHVIITKIPDLKRTLLVANKIKKTFNFDTNEVKKLIKVSGKLGRGCNIIGLSADVIEFYVLRGMNGSVQYKDLDDVPSRKILFWKKLLDIEQDKIAEKYGG